MLQLLEMVGRPQTLGFQADMAHTLLYVLGHNAPEDAILPADFDWKDAERLDAALQTAHRRACGRGRSTSTWRRTTPRCTAPARTTRRDATACRTIPTASSTSSKWPATGCATTADNLTKKFQHICWDGCMFPNKVMMDPSTWNTILATMIAVREDHGWRE